LVLIFSSFLLSAKPEIVVPGSGIRFRYFIFEISGKPSFVEAVLEGTPVYIPPLTYIVNRKIIKNPNEFSG
jgi:hypothetical protein